MEIKAHTAGSVRQCKVVSGGLLFGIQYIHTNPLFQSSCQLLVLE